MTEFFFTFLSVLHNSPYEPNSVSFICFLFLLSLSLEALSQAFFKLSSVSRYFSVCIKFSILFSYSLKSCLSPSQLPFRLSQSFPLISCPSHVSHWVVILKLKMTNSRHSIFKILPKQHISCF